MPPLGRRNVRPDLFAGASERLRPLWLSDGYPPGPPRRGFFLNAPPSSLLPVVVYEVRNRIR